MAEISKILFGGSFDPIHNGHLQVAHYAIKQFKADEVIFIPAKQSPLKKQPPNVNDHDRIEMVKIATKGCEGFKVSRFDCNRPAPSYSIDTIKYFKELFNDNVKLLWIIGADVVGELKDWYKIEEIFELCEMAIVHRASFPLPDFDDITNTFGQEIAHKLQMNIIEMPAVDLSSTEVRRKIKSGQNFKNMLPIGVHDYIIEHGLYR